MSRIALLTLAATLLLAAAQGQTSPPCYRHWDTLIPTLLNRLDYDSDGNVTESDFTQFTNHHIDVLNLTGNEADRVKDNYIKIWSSFNACSPQQTITRSTFAAVYKCVGQGNCKKAAEVIVRYFYDMIDVNANNEMTLQEFINRLKVHAWSDDVAPLLFGKLDTNRDGIMSWVEYFDAHDMWLSDPDHPNTGFVAWVTDYMPSSVQTTEGRSESWVIRYPNIATVVGLAILNMFIYA